MPRETAEVKGRRLLVEGRLVVERIDEQKIIARCRGDSGGLYALGFDPRTRSWRCTCEARGRCSHLIALQLVALQPAGGRDGRASSCRRAPPEPQEPPMGATS